MRMFVAMIGCVAGLFVGTSRAEEPESAAPVALRAESFTVPPSTGPVVHVAVRNLRQTPYQGSLTMTGPDGWRIVPKQREVSLGPGQTGRVPFSIEKGRNLAANSYPIEVSATGGGTTAVRKRNVACASAPYFKPTIDGDPADFKDAIPVTFDTGGKSTTISTYWNRRRFSILVAVE